MFKLFKMLASLGVLALVLLSSPAAPSPAPRPTPTPNGNLMVDFKHSFFDDFEIHEGQVILRCRIAILNQTGKETQVALFADSQSEHEFGLLASGKLIGLNPETGENLFVVPALADHFETFTVYFVGEHGVGQQKRNRLLPEEITLIEIR